MPPPASSLFFEYYRIEGEIYVKMTFKKALDEAIDLILPGFASTYMLLDDFSTHIKNRFVNCTFTNLTAECNRPYVPANHYWSGL